ncbi:MAG: helix-turn-helix domain-containing protein [Aureliella sp.]
MMQNKGFVTVKEAARLLDVVPNTVRAWGAAGKIVEHRHPVNNYRLYAKDEIEALVAQIMEPVSVSKKAPRKAK